jgi:shikimate kinase
VAKEGWASFRTKEAALLQKLLHQDNLVVATGGGAILHQDIWPAVMEKSFVVWLNADIDTVRTRLLEDHKTAEQRPSLTGESLLVETEKIMKEREPLYRKGSHLQINSDQPLAKIIATIEKEFKE